MTATVEFAGVTATIKDWQWASERAGLAQLLNSMLPIYGPSGSDPAPDYHAALAAAEALGGEVVEFDLPDFVEGRVY